MVRKEGRSEERKCLWRRNSNRKGKKGEVRHRGGHVQRKEEKSGWGDGMSLE